ncbi:MAG: sulfatase family protein, partial [Planctomycetota bacterium]
MPRQYKLGEKPNVIFILSDQHNAKIMAHQGHPDVKTPNFDRMAKEGVRFDACTTNNPICTPSRISLLSGQYCHNHGYYGLGGPNPKGLPTVFGHFKRVGYKTALIGKSHCPEYWVENDTDCFHDTCGTSIEGRSREYEQYLADRDLSDLEDHSGFHEFGRKGKQTSDARASMVSYRDGQEGWAVTKSIEFMGNCVKDNKPFFLHLSLPKPHQCYAPAKEFWDLYDQSKLHLPPNIDYDLKLKAPNLIKTAEYWKKGDWTLFKPKTFKAGRLRKLHGYLGCISHVDHAVGEVLDWLEKSGLDSNTIVVYTSDHGDYACEHDIMEKAPGISSDAITRVPMIWWSPGKFKAGHVAKEVVETVDIVPTLCTLARLDELQTADGQDISTMLTGATGDKNRIGITEFIWSKSIRKGNWRLVTYSKKMFVREYPDGFGELYNIKDDPYEMKNLYFEPGHADKVVELKEDFFEWMITKKRPTTIHPSKATTPKKDYQTKRYHHQTV